jgi:hypothetical protein
MANITIKEFSCVKSADLETADITAIIGPHGSGKSVLCKLLYFCRHVCDAAIDYASRAEGLPAFRRAIEDEFVRWFPQSAWGAAAFSIRYREARVAITITPRIRAGRSSEAKVAFNSGFVEYYGSLLALNAELNEKNANVPEYLRPFLFRSVAKPALQQAVVGETGAESQVYIPAGRAFFTVLGRALMAFDQSGMLDPISREFGRRFASFRALAEQGRIDVASLSASFAELLGGSLERGKDRVLAIRTTDDRLVPLNALSSGQQEMLPLLGLLMEDSSGSGRHQSKRKASRRVFVEEPEAHLFPETQARVVQWLVRLRNEGRFLSQLVLTTHSPYVLAKLNNLAFAGKLAETRRPPRPSVLNEVIPADARIAAHSIRVYALIEGEARDVIEDDGLINSDFLDSVSDQMATEFDALLRLEGRE